MTARDELEAMLARMAQGDRAALSALYSATSATLFGIALGVLNDRTESEDALQEIYVKLWLQANRYRSNGLSPMTWLITVARNHAVDRLCKRKHRAWESLDEVAEPVDRQPTLKEATLASALRGQVAACLGTLRPQDADAVWRAYVLGETYHDLAVRYAMPINSLKTKNRRSLIQLSECLED